MEYERQKPKKEHPGRMALPSHLPVVETIIAELLRPLYAVHRLYVFREIYQMIDESPIKVQDRDKPGACHQGCSE